MGKQRDGWERQESGWYTHPKLGGICREGGFLWGPTGREYGPGWYYWPTGNAPRGPYPTLAAAKRAARRG